MKRFLFFFTAASVVTFASCSKSESSDSPTNGNAKVQLSLTDAPADYEAVYISVKEVRINVGNAEAENAPEGTKGGEWITYPLGPAFAQPIDLLELRNGDYMYMGEPLALPAGKISQIRLILNETGNTVLLKDGSTHELTTPSAQQSGLKINLNQTLVPDGIYHISLDFDAARSVVARGNGMYNLKPVIKATTVTPDFGSISGFVLPAESKTTVYLLKGTDTIGVALPETPGSVHGTGFYRFTNLAAGTYNIFLNADSLTKYKDSTISNVVVAAGKTTSTNTATLSLKP